MVSADGLPTHAGTIKGVSMCLLFLIAAANDLDVLTGDIGNAFVNAETLEKTHCCLGPKFGEKEAR